jgi:hypothetical protein
MISTIIDELVKSQKYAFLSWFDRLTMNGVVEIN